MATRNELQETKNAAAIAVKEYHSKHDKEWNAEHEANWLRLNEAHDTAAKAIVDYISSERASAERALKLKAIEDGERAVTGDRAIGLDENRRRESNPERIVYRHQELRANAFQGWALA